MFLCVWGSLAHPRESVPNPANVEKCVNERGRAGLLACVCVCVCVRYQFVQEHMLCKGYFFCLCILVFVSVCVHLRPLIQHHQDTGLNEGSYSPFLTLLSQQVAHNVLFSLRKLLVFLLFLCSYLFYLSPSLLLSHSFSLSVLLLTRFWLGLLLLLKPSHIFFLPLFEKWLSALSHQLSGQQKDTITGTQIERALLLFLS